MSVDDPAARQAEMLLEEIARQLARSTADIEAAAATEVEQIRQRAREKARQRVRHALDERRAIERQRLHQVRAELDTERRRRLATDARRALDAAWPRMGEALQRRWADAASRASWIDALLATAVRRLGTRAWTLRHPPAAGLDDTLRAALSRHGVAGATLVADATLTAGLVIEADGARLDGTPAALLADRPSVEADLLAHMVPMAPEGAGRG